MNRERERERPACATFSCTFRETARSEIGHTCKKFVKSKELRQGQYERSAAAATLQVQKKVQSQPSGALLRQHSGDTGVQQQRQRR